MKKLITLISLITLTYGAHAQWEICYAPGVIDIYYVTYYSTTGCYVDCATLPPSSCTTAIPTPVPINAPEICTDYHYFNKTSDDISVFFEYQLACGNYVLPAWTHYEELVQTCYTLSCSGYNEIPGCIELASDNTLTPIGGMNDNKRMVSYKLKDQCISGSDTGSGGPSSNCSCGTLALEIGGTLYRNVLMGVPASPFGNGIKYFTNIPKPSGGNLIIYLDSGTVQFL